MFLSLSLKTTAHERMHAMCKGYGMSMQDLEPVSQGSLSQVYSSLIPQVAFQITFSSIAASAAQPSQVKNVLYPISVCTGIPHGAPKCFCPIRLAHAQCFRLAHNTFPFQGQEVDASEGAAGVYAADAFRQHVSLRPQHALQVAQLSSAVTAALEAATAPVQVNVTVTPAGQGSSPARRR